MSLLHLSDKALAKRMLGGDERAFEEFFKEYFPGLYRFALSRLGDPSEAEDVTQEVFFTVFNVLGSFRGQSSLLVWIFGITRHTVIRRFRRVRPRLESLDAGNAREVPARDVPPDRTVDARRMLGRCEDVIHTQLSPLQRRIFHLKHLRRQSIRSIAKSLGKSEDAIKANLYRMRRAIAQGAPGLETLLGR